MEFLRFSRFVRFFRFWFLTCPPFGFAAEAVDTELAEEFEMVAELIGGHDQRETGLPARNRRSGSTRSRMTAAMRALL